MARPNRRLRRCSAVLLFLVVLLTAPCVGFALSAPQIASPKSAGLVTSNLVLEGTVSTSVVELRVHGASLTTVTLAPTEDGRIAFTVRAKVGYGKRTVAVDASDGTTWSPRASVSVWNLGTVPRDRRLVLVDKSDYMLYVIRGNAVVRSFPIAIGMRGTPTPTGVRYLGRPKPPGAGGSVWGPFRMRLYRLVHVRVSYWTRVNGTRVRRTKTVHRHVGTSYYIHGTNDPDSIGTPASHGCIRLYNRDLRRFRDLTYRYQLTIIRK